MNESQGSDLPSILEVIAARGVQDPDVRLRAEDDPPLTVSEVPLNRTGRYRVLGQIAEGGVGLVLKGHDADLKRDVALKVIRDRYAGNRDLLRRFVEEAQIGAQLQHPGVVPVYELGLGEDRRPFFSMKLVKGRTLAALLADRADPGEDRRRFIAIFLAVAETVAYAHSRGVIHRDLKSSNVMIGAFGEVQVVDWGFAKVLSEGGVADERRSRRQGELVSRIATLRSGSEGSESVAGAVMGTPAYMPPEQALGQIDDLDERSDVFALGAILTEILTGEPPYLGTSAERLTQAGRGDLADALERLDACDAEPGLKTLARKCLAPMRADRPRDAGVLVRSLGRFLAEAGERERRSRIEAIDTLRQLAEAQGEADREQARAEEANARAAELRAKEQRHRARREASRGQAEEARRLRRRAAIVAGIALLAVLVAGGVVLLVDSSRARHAAENSVRADALIERSTLFSGQGSWDEALAALDRARDLGGGGAAARIDSVRAGVLAAKAAADRENRQAALDLALERELEGILLSGEGDFAALFGTYGFDPRQPSDRERVLAFRGIEEPLCAALDAWAWQYARGAMRDRLLALARELDPDMERAGLRDAVARETWPEFFGRTEAGVELDDGRTAELVGRALLRSGRSDEAVAFLERARLRYPGRPLLGALLAQGLLKLDIPMVGAARRVRRAVLATRPGCDPLRRVLERAETAGTDLTAFRKRVKYLNATEWMQVTVPWSRATGRRRRIYFSKRSVTNALLAHKGGESFEAAPMIYPEGTIFVAESLDAAGKVFRTEAIRIRWPIERMEFMLFDEEGNRASEFRKDLKPAPRICASCHLPRGDARGYYSPMMDFPTEAEEDRLEIDERYRDPGIVIRFREGYHCGSNLFGPYGAIWLSKLKADAAAADLSPSDKPYFDRLWRKYPDLLGR